MPIQKDKVISHNPELGHWKHNFSRTNIPNNKKFSGKKKKADYNSFSTLSYLQVLSARSIILRTASEWKIPTDSFSENKGFFNT